MAEYTNEIDAPVDDVIYESIKPSSPRSFFLFAGAGSGKTRTLVNVLGRFKDEFGQEYKLKDINSPSNQELNKAEAIFKSYGLNV